MASAVAPDDKEAFPAPSAADSFACVLEHLGDQCIDLDESPDTKPRAASASASSTVLDSSASPNKKQRHAFATIPVTQQKPGPVAGSGDGGGTRAGSGDYGTPFLRNRRCSRA